MNILQNDNKNEVNNTLHATQPSVSMTYISAILQTMAFLQIQDLLFPV